MLKQIFSMATPGTIGLSIECDALRMAESRGERVMRCSEIFYPAGISPGSAAFIPFLKDSLHAFCPGSQHLPLWVSDGLPGLQLRYLLLPTVKTGSLSDMVCWAFRKDSPFDAAQTLFDYDVQMQSGSSASAKMHVMAYTVPRHEVESLTALLEKAHLHPTGIIIPPFAMRNLARLQGALDGGARLCVFAGADATSLLLTRDGRVHSCRVFKTGMHAILDVVTDHLPDCTQIQAYQRIGSALSAAEPDSFDMQVREVVDRIFQQIELSLDVYMHDHAGETIDGLHVMGAIAGISSFSALLEDRLGVAVQHVALPDTDISASGDPDHGLAPDTQADRMALAVGTALSQRERMPNLLCIGQERETQARHTHRSALAVLLAALAVALLHLAHSVCGHCNIQLQQQLQAEQVRLATLSPRVNQSMLMVMMQEVVSERLTRKRAAAHWLPFAAFRPLTEQALPDVCIKEITYAAAGVGNTLRGNRTHTPNNAEKAATLSLRGVVTGDPALQRAKLASYAMRLEDNPLIACARTMNIPEGTGDAAELLAFVIEVELIAFPTTMQPATRKDAP